MASEWAVTFRDRAFATLASGPRTLILDATYSGASLDPVEGSLVHPDSAAAALRSVVEELSRDHQSLLSGKTLEEAVEVQTRS